MRSPVCGTENLEDGGRAALQCRSPRCPGRPFHGGAVRPWPTPTLFELVPTPGPLNPLSGRLGSEPSSPAPESIACQTCLAESRAGRLQPHAAAHPPGTIPLAEKKKPGARSGSHLGRPIMSDDPSQCYCNYPIHRVAARPLDVLRERQCPRTLPLHEQKQPASSLATQA